MRRLLQAISLEFSSQVCNGLASSPRGCLGRELGEFSTFFVNRGEASKDQSREAIKLSTQSSADPGFETQVCSFLCTKKCCIRFLRMLTIARKRRKHRKRGSGLTLSDPENAVQTTILVRVWI